MLVAFHLRSSRSHSLDGKPRQTIAFLLAIVVWLMVAGVIAHIAPASQPAAVRLAEPG